MTIPKKTMPAAKSISIIGGGSWGAALADRLQLLGRDVRLLVRNARTVDALGEGLVRQLPASRLAQPLRASTDPASLASAEIIYLAVPLAAYLDVLDQISTYAKPHTPLVIASKGLIADDKSGGLFLPEWLAGVAATHPIIMLSGPSFADEVIAGKPTALVAASSEPALATQVAEQFSGQSIASNLRVYTSADPMGVAIGGAVKNVIAIAAGIACGLELGDNARAALTTRGLAEMQRLAAHLGGSPQTLSGLSGLGDLMLSCGGPHSRNMAYGLALGSGSPVPQQLTEGRLTTARLIARAKHASLEMPVCEAVDQIINHRQDLHQTLSNLLSRPIGSE